MVGNKTTKKTKKPVETTLGKAPIRPKEDVSHLRKPIETSVYGIKQVLTLLETATDEVKDLITYECDIMYECRICRSIFRCLSNFILHKRNFCQEKFSPAGFVNNNAYNLQMSVATFKEPIPKTTALEKVIEKLHEIDRVCKSAKESLTEESETLKNMDDLEEKASNFNHIVLEKIDSNDSGIFQTLVSDSTDNNQKEFTKTEVMEIYKKMENNVPVLDPEGKICGFTSNQIYEQSLFPKTDFKCTECNQKFATQKSLTNHMKCIHNPSRIIYVCPTCKETLSNPWCVYRHLLKVHRMTSKQVRKMREQIHNNWIRRGDESLIKKKKNEVSQNLGDSENQWINDIEGDKDFQMCAGCGKHFERKAALHSHSQMCAKRLEVCNNIKENAKKKDEDKATEKARLDKINSEKNSLKGALKRKGHTIYSYQRKRLNNNTDTNEEIARVTDISDNKISQSENNNVETILSEKLILNDVSECIERPIPLDNVESQSLTDEAISFNSSDECDSLEEKDEISISYVSHNEDARSDLLSDNVSFADFCEKIQEIAPEEIKLSSSSATTSDDDVIFISERTKQETTIIKDIVEETIVTDAVQNIIPAEQNFLERSARYMDLKKLLCTPCGITFKLKDELLWHMSAHFSWFRFQCSKCSFISFNKNDCTLHAQKIHSLDQNTANSYVLPLPDWKAVLLAHDFQLLKDSEGIGGKHTDEQICIEEENQINIDEPVEDDLESDSSLFYNPILNNFEDVNKSTEKTEMQMQNENVIDMQENSEDFQLLPEPLELAMPAIVSEALRSPNFNEEQKINSDSVEFLQNHGDESNDDWGLSKVCTKPSEVELKDEIEKKRENDEIIAPLKSRPVRTRTKVKQNDDFLYYDSSAKLNDLISKNYVRVKSRVSAKSVPTMQRRKN